MTDEASGGAGDGSGAGARPADFEERAKRRARARAETQTTVFIQVTLAALFFFGLAVGAAFYYVAQQRSDERGAVNVLDAFIEAGAEGDALSAHRLFSDRGLQAYPLWAVDDLFASQDALGRGFFRGYRELRLTSYELRPSTRPALPDVAFVEATVRYEDKPPAELSARLERDNERWRIGAVQLTREVPE